MGWWWSSSNPPSSDPPSSLSVSPPRTALPTASPASTEPTPTSSPPTNSPTPLSRDEAAISELRDLFAEINPKAAAAASKTYKNVPSEPVPTPEDEANSLYPTTMSCTQAFDNAYYCSSMGGQLNNIYRYGGLRSCTEQWRQWRLCMRMKAMGKDERKRRVREWYMQQEAKKRVGRSSERVWDARKEMVEGAFEKDVDGLDRDSEGGVTGVVR